MARVHETGTSAASSQHRGASSGVAARKSRAARLSIVCSPAPASQPYVLIWLLAFPTPFVRRAAVRRSSRPRHPVRLLFMFPALPLSSVFAPPARCTLVSISGGADAPVLCLFSVLLRSVRSSVFLSHLPRLLSSITVVAFPISSRISISEVLRPKGSILLVPLSIYRRSCSLSPRLLFFCASASYSSTLISVPLLGQRLVPAVAFVCMAVRGSSITNFPTPPPSLT